MANDKLITLADLAEYKRLYDLALKNGTLVPNKSVQARSLQAVSTDSGAVQDTPFINQGTGTANGTASVDTSPVGKHLEKQGNSVVVNQLVNTGDTEVATISGHKYWTYINNVIALVTSTGTNMSLNNASVDKIVDLTQWFNGNIPQDLLDHPENAERYGITSDLAYNTGTLTNANGRYLECGGRNVWDEEWENGELDTTTGAKISGSKLISKNYIRVISNIDYYIKQNGNGGCRIYYYDTNKNYISYSSSYFSQTTFATPSNCEYIKFQTYNDKTSYNAPITISLYYETGDSYDQHFVYEQPKVYDTGTEVLRSCPNKKDIKLPSGLITRYVGNRAYTSGDENDNTLLTDGTTTNYPLVTPTTEQGTPFSENIEINDYGTMGWKDTNEDYVAVPQGCKIFYPADYVLFIDSLGQREDIEWDANEIVSHTELGAETTARETKDTILQNAIGGTLRQTLVAFYRVLGSTFAFNDTAYVDLGTLNWTYNSSMGGFSTNDMAGLINISAKMISTEYMKSISFSSTTMPSMDLFIGLNNNGSNVVINGYFALNALIIKDTSLGTDATAFKQAMKGVLLAYEKAN